MLKTLLIAFISSLCISCNFLPILTKENISQTQHKQNILKFLLEDRENGKARNKRLRQIPLEDNYYPITSLPEYSDTISEYLKKSESLDDSNLPKDFQYVWQQHLQTWRVHSNHSNQIKEMVEQGENKKEINKAEANPVTGDDIEGSWETVKQIAEKYGAILPEENY